MESINCTCADIPPTMPTCRDKHLATCPIYLVARLAAAEQRWRELTDSILELFGWEINVDSGGCDGTVYRRKDWQTTKEEIVYAYTLKEILEVTKSQLTASQGRAAAIRKAYDVLTREDFAVWMDRNADLPGTTTYCGVVESSCSSFGSTNSSAHSSTEALIAQRDALVRQLEEAQGRLELWKDYPAISCKYTDMEKRCMAAERDLTALAREQAGLREALKQINLALLRDPLIRKFNEVRFWDAHHVDIVWRHNGEDKRYEADWIKGIWNVVQTALHLKQQALAPGPHGAPRRGDMNGEALTREQMIKDLVDKFLAWPLPDSVCSDLCATKQGYPHRTGTSLLTAVEARQMFEYLLDGATYEELK